MNFNLSEPQFCPLQNGLIGGGRAQKEVCLVSGCVSYKEETGLQRSNGACRGSFALGFKAESTRRAGAGAPAFRMGKVGSGPEILGGAEGPVPSNAALLPTPQATALLKSLKKQNPFKIKKEQLDKRERTFHIIDNCAWGGNKHPRIIYLPNSGTRNLRSFNS
ncbi:hypothetical protein H1C71_005285 [Ictidomys tridecemlineatus]|nr:hypothetical protein H1C71_005285 [Ictidomys tridecemlineatus]